MSIYAKLLQAAKEGKYYKINLKTKSLKIQRKQYIGGGDVLVDEDLICNEDFEKFDILVGDIKNMSWKNIVWHLYNIFKYSVPDKNYRGNSYFKAVDESELTDGERAFGVPRHLAQAYIEGYILLAGLTGWIKYDEPNNHWFWQSEKDKELIVFKEWID